jgi:RNA polymerase sigma-70 factor (ECF subfamily)
MPTSPNESPAPSAAPALLKAVDPKSIRSEIPVIDSLPVHGILDSGVDTCVALRSRIGSRFARTRVALTHGMRLTITQDAFIPSAHFSRISQTYQDGYDQWSESSRILLMNDPDSVGSGEDELIAAARAGSQGAMVELYRRHRGLVIGYVLRMTGNRDLADEVFASTFAAFFRGLPRYQSRGRLAAYLLRVARGRLADEARARSRLGRRLPNWGAEDTPETEPIDFALGPSEAAATSELAGRAVMALQKLPERLREVVVLRIYEGMDYASIAVIVGACETTVRSRMRYALEALRKSMDALREP